jgi:dienelactone hydrolase
MHFATVLLKCWRFVSVVALLAASALVLTPAPLAQGLRIETVRFQTKAQAGIRIDATLFTPRKARFPIAAVVIMPSSGGVEDTREIYYAKELAREGIAALVVDSFGPRGLETSLYDQSQLTEWDMELDAFAALARLARDRRFRRDRIAIMGVSKGGTVAMNTALAVRRKWAGVERVGFAVHIAISPDCTWVTRNPGNTGTPVLFMLAELDDQTPPGPCLRQADRMRQAGNNRIETQIYKGAHHAWEELGPSPEYDAKVENYSNCHVWVEDNGDMFSATTGKLVPENKWHDWAKKNCMTLGATCCGGNRILKATARDDILSFLKKHDFR